MLVKDWLVQWGSKKSWWDADISFYLRLKQKETKCQEATYLYMIHKRMTYHQIFVYAKILLPSVCICSWKSKIIKDQIKNNKPRENLSFFILCDKPKISEERLKELYLCIWMVWKLLWIDIIIVLIMYPS